MPRDARRHIALFFSVLAAGCGGLQVDLLPVGQEGDWIQYGGSPSRANIASPELMPPLRQAWEYDALAGISASPLVHDSVVILANLRGELHAIHLRNGEEMGRKTVTSPISGTPVLYGSIVIAAGGSGAEALVAFDLAEGKIAWRNDCGASVSSPLLAGDLVLVGTTAGVVCCLGAADGSEVWKAEPFGEPEGELLRAAPAADAGVVTIGSTTGIVVGLDLETGVELWRQNVGGSVFASPAIRDTNVIIGTLRGKVLCLALKTGEVRWVFDAGAALFGGPALSTETAFVGSSDGRLHAIDLNSGQGRWKFSARSVINAAPLISGGLVYAGSLDHILYALDGRSGKELWRFEAPGRIKVTPVQRGSTLLVVSEDRSVIALRPQVP